MHVSERLALHLGKTPSIHKTAFVAPGAVVVGDVTLHEWASVWYGAILRGDIHRIEIGPASNLQDGTIVHLADEQGVVVGEYVTCGHRVTLHACTVGNEVLVGMGATIMDGAAVGDRCIIGAHALVTPGTRIPPGSLVLGMPARVVRSLDDAEQRALRARAEKYVEVARHHRDLAQGRGV